MHVVTTVSDQYSNNVQAYDMLQQDANRMCLAKGEEIRNLGHCISDKEIVHTSDPPHLVKDIRNNFLMYDVEFRW